MNDQENTAPPPTDKDKFKLCIDMLKGYYAGLEGRVEKTSVLLVAVLGWVVTSNTVHKTIENNPVVLAMTLSVLFMFFVMSWANISHLLHRFLQVQDNIEELNYIDVKYYTRYRMPKHIKGVPVLLIYMLPLIILYTLISGYLLYLYYK